MQTSTHTIWASLSIWTRLCFYHSQKTFGQVNAYVLRFLSLIQVLILLCQNLEFSKHNCKFMIQPLFDSLKNMIGFDKAANLFEEASFSIFILIILLVLYFSFLGAVIIIFPSQQYNISRSIEFASRLTTLHAEVLYYPICLLLTNIAEMLFLNKLAIIPKGIFFSLLGILFFLNAFITFFKIMFCYSLINSKRLISRKGCLHLFLMAILKLFLPILHLSSLKNTIRSKASSEISSVAISLGIALYLWGYSFVKFPEYDVKMMKGHMVFNSIATIVTLCQMITLITRDDGSTLNVAFLIMPFWVKFNLILFEKLIKKLLFHTNRVKNTNYLTHFETLCEYFAEDSLLNLKKKTFTKGALYTYRFNPTDFQSTLSSHDSIFKQKMNIATLLKKYYDAFQINNLLNRLGSLSYAYLILKYFDMVPKAYSICILILNCKSSMPDQISAFHIISKVQKTLKKRNNLEFQENSSLRLVKEYFMAEETFNGLKTLVSKFIQGTINFWETLKLENPDVYSVIKKANSLENQVMNMQNYWKNSEKTFNENFPMAYLLYGTLQADFLNRPGEGTKKIMKFDQLALGQNLMKENLNWYLEESAVVLVSTKKKEIGNVLNATEAFYKMFEVEKKSLVDHNINQIMPKFFADRHSQFLVNYYETGKNRLFGKESRQYGKNKNNHIFPINMGLTLHNMKDHGVVVSGLIRKAHDQKEYLLVTENGFIQEFSKKIGTLLNLEPYKNIPIQSICPKYDLNTNRAYSTAFIAIKSPSKFSIKCKVLIETYHYGNDRLHIMVLSLEESVMSNGLYIQNDRKDFDASEERRVEKSKNLDVHQDLPSLDSAIDLITPKDPSDILASSKKVDQNSSAVVPEAASSSEKVQTTYNISLQLENRNIDDIQDKYEKSYSNAFKLFLTATFAIILLLNLGMVGVQYLTFKSSINDIKFAAEVVNASYSRLNALSWIYRYAIRYQAIVSKIATVTIPELDRYKIVISSNRELIRIANNELLESIMTGQEGDQKMFFQEDIELFYNNETSGLEKRKTNSFQSINILTEKLMTFDITPHSVLCENGNPDLEFVRQNIPNSLLLSSEELIEITTKNLIDKSDNKNQILIIIFSLNLVTTLIILLITVIPSYRDLKNIKGLMKILITVNQRRIDALISKLKLFNKAIFDKQILLVRGLQIENMKQDKVNGESGIYSLSPKMYNIRRLVSVKIKQSLFILILLSPIFILNFLEFKLTSCLFDDLLITNNRFIVASKARYLINMASATVFDLIVFYNTTMVRNEPTTKQFEHSINDIVSNELIFQTFTDVNGQFIAPTLETLFRGKPCTLVVDYPGSNNPVNCPHATNSENFGIFAVNSEYQEEIFGIGKEMLDNLAVENAKVMYPKMVNSLGHKTSTLIGAYMYVCDLMKRTFDKQIDKAFSDNPIRLAIEISLMSLSGILSIWFLLTRILDDSHVRRLLKIIPYSEIVKSKPLKKAIKYLYKGKLEPGYFEDNIKG